MNKIYYKMNGPWSIGNCPHNSSIRVYSAACADCKYFNSVNEKEKYIICKKEMKNDKR